VIYDVFKKLCGVGNYLWLHLESGFSEGKFIDTIVVDFEQMLSLTEFFIVVNAITNNKVIGHFKPRIVSLVLMFKIDRISLVESYGHSEATGPQLI
jgi:hypothetical protein